MTEEKKVACFDFDGVIHRYTGWGRGELGSPLKEGLDIMARFFVHDYEILIHTCRINKSRKHWKEQMKYIQDWLDHYNVPYTRLVADDDGKPIANVYFDDRAVPVPSNYKNIGKNPFYTQYANQKDTNIDIATIIYQAGLKIGEREL